MKTKQILLGGLLFAALSVTALQSSAQVEMGVRAGFNLSNLAGKDEDGDRIEGNKLNPGFHAGVTFDIPVADEFYVQPGALFSTKGFRVDENEEELNVKGKFTPYYIEVPVNFLYKPELGNGKLLLGVGPYFAYGLGGKWKVEASLGDEKADASGNLEFKNDYNASDLESLDEPVDGMKFPYLKPFDYGANLLAGYEFGNRFSAQLNAQLGLANLEPKIEGEKSDGKLKNVGFGVSVGYKF